MKKTELMTLMNQLGMTPSRKMGQNFLVDENFLAYIVRTAALRPGDRVLEVGPGFGALTGRLLESGAELAAIEFDRKLAAWLRETFVPKGLRLIEGDACKADIAGVFGKGKTFRLISNLPYSAGTVIVAKMLDLETPPQEMIVMLQKEVALRFSAAPGAGDYSALSVRIQSMYECCILKTIPPDVFFPRPDVDSALIRLTLKEDRPSRETGIMLSRLVRAAFAQRRKKMAGQLAAVFGRETTLSLMRETSLDPDIRAERVSVQVFLRMASLLLPPSASQEEEQKTTMAMMAAPGEEKKER